MPFGVKPVCMTCKTTASTIWRKGNDGEVLCNSCGLKQNNGSSGTSDSGSVNEKTGTNGNERISLPVRKSARLKPGRNKVQQTTKFLATKGKNRRVVFKKNPIKAPTAVSTVITSEYVFHDNIYWQTGDVVSVMDVEGGIFYAQIRGFLQDQYCDKSAVITWLLPTQSSPRDRFDPSTYILGPEEELPRPIDAFEFVCRAPSEYYKSQDSPYPVKPTKPELGFIWTSLGPEIRPAPTQAEIFGFTDIGKDETETGKKPEKRGRKGSKAAKKESNQDIEMGEEICVEV